MFFQLGLLNNTINSLHLQLHYKISFCLIHTSMVNNNNQNFTRCDTTSQHRIRRIKDFFYSYKGGKKITARNFKKKHVIKGF